MTTKKTHTFDEMFFRVDREVSFGCEVCGIKVDNYYQLAGDHNAAYACRECADEYVEEVNAGIWEW